MAFSECFGWFQRGVASSAGSGRYGARQMGLDAVDTDFVVFFDSDDMMRPQLLSAATGKYRRQRYSGMAQSGA